MYKKTGSKVVRQSKMDIETISRSWERIDTVDQMMGHTSDKVMLNTGENEKKKKSPSSKKLYKVICESPECCAWVYTL